MSADYLCLIDTVYCDDEKTESVVVGRGVAFSVKIGQHIDPSLVEKHFVLNGKKGRKDFDSLRLTK